MKRKNFILMAALLTVLFLGAATIPCSAEKNELTQEKVQSAINKTEQLLTNLKQKVGADEVTLNKDDTKKINILVRRVTKELEKANARLERGDLKAAFKDNEEAIKHTERAFKYLDTALQSQEEGGEL